MAIEKLIVVAGPEGTGKTTLINRIQKKDVLSLSEVLNVGDTSGWECMIDKHVPENTELFLDGLYLHYNMLRPGKAFFRNGSQNNENSPSFVYENDSCLEILSMAKEIIFLTLYTEKGTLIERILSDRESVVFTNLRGFRFQRAWRRYQEIMRIAKCYDNAQEVLRMYQQWHQFCERYRPQANVAIDTTDWDYHLYSTPQEALNTLDRENQR